MDCTKRNQLIGKEQYIILEFIPHLLMSSAKRVSFIFSVFN